MYIIMKSIFSKRKKLPQVIVKQSTVVFFFLMIALKTHRDLIGKCKWIGKMTFKFKAWLTPCLFPQKSM